ncbi:hypothetical protein BJY04DRAFT_229033 [Aspergillus karnatakaensis]|uniref:flavin monoamine oxidase family protein n=1 Tax=Aspergillus karnatakaensis TaxID=1810916 RepID=UPI003CCD7B1F
MTTRDGFYLNNDTAAFQQGLKSVGAVSPPTNISKDGTRQYDVIVVGAGYAGLTACRDLCIAGFKVLLLDARDRIGGRTYTAEIDGHLYEMGGTWVHWNQPHTYREMSRYGLTALLESHTESSTGYNYCTTFFRGKARNLDPDTVHAMTEKAFIKLCNVDGKFGRKIIPYPHNPHHNPEAKRWEQLSVAQRLDQIKSSLTDDEIAVLQARLSSMCGSDMEKAGFFDVLRWWALGGYTMDGLYETGDQFKIPTGQSSFARCFFEEAIQTHNLTYSFNTGVASIQDLGNRVLVNETWSAKRLVCTIPLNVLEKVRFEPALSPAKLVAAASGNINQGAKFHLNVLGSAHRSWSSTSWPMKRVCSGAGDGLTSEGNTHVVCWGVNKEFSAPEQDARDFVADCLKSHHMEVKKTIWHNWSIDPFSGGSWCMFPPDFSFKHLEALQQRAGNVLFASSDWASGWRGYIDGAIERGGLAARDVVSELGFPRRGAES